MTWWCNTVAVVPASAAPWPYRSWSAWKPCCCFLFWPLVISIWFWNPRRSADPFAVCCWCVDNGYLVPWDFEIGQIRIHLRKQTQSPRNLLSLNMSIDPSSKGKENTHTHRDWLYIYKLQAYINPESMWHCGTLKWRVSWHIYIVFFEGA